MANAAQDPQELLVILASIKAAADVLAKQKADVEEQLIAVLDVAGKNNISATTSQGGTVTGTVVRAERVVIDAEALEKALDKRLWEKVTKRVLDNNLLEAHVTTGAIDEQVVAACTEIKQNKPYVKVGGDKPTVTGLEQVQTINNEGKEKAAVKRVKAKRAATKAAAPK